MLAKLTFIADHHVVIRRFHDFAHRMQPDIIVNGEATAFGWSAWRDRLAPWRVTWRVTIPPTTRAAVAYTIRQWLGTHALRVIGDPGLVVTNVMLSPGAPGFGLHRMQMHDAGMQLLVVGEAREWDTVEWIDAPCSTLT